MGTTCKTVHNGIHNPDAHDKTQYLDELDHPIRNQNITKNIGENLGFQTFTRKEESSGRNVISFSFDEEGSFFAQQTVQFHVITCHTALIPWHSIYLVLLYKTTQCTYSHWEAASKCRKAAGKQIEMCLGFQISQGKKRAVKGMLFLSPSSSNRTAEYSFV